MAEYSICLLCLLRAICEDMPKCGPDDDIAFTLSIFCAGFSCKPRPHFFCLQLAASCVHWSWFGPWSWCGRIISNNFEIWEFSDFELWIETQLMQLCQGFFFIGHGSVHGLCVDASFRTTESSQALNFESNRNKVNVILTWLEISILALHAVPMRLEVIFSDEYQLQGIEISDGRQQGWGNTKVERSLAHWTLLQTANSWFG